MRRLQSLPSHVIQFGRFLRTREFFVGPNEEAEALDCLISINWSDPEEFKEVLRLIFCKSYSQAVRFDDLYSEYWREFQRAVDSKTRDSKIPEERPTPQKPSLQSIKSWLYGKDTSDEELSLARASENITKGLQSSDWVNDAHREWKKVIWLIQKYIARQPSRRYVPADAPGILDFRSTLSKNLRLGNETLTLEFKRKKKNKAKIILLCDVSKSMENYSLFLIQLMYNLQNSRLDIHTYAFSTSLFFVKPYLKSDDVKKSIHRLSDYVDEWSSGTKIGACLRDFLRVGQKFLGRKTFVFIVSDGWDSGDLTLLEYSMRKLKQSVKKVIWVNPLAQSSSFKPEVLGMKTALPFVDFLVPALDVRGLQFYLSKMK